jgi:hypothetical protein
VDEQEKKPATSPATSEPGGKPRQQILENLSTFLRPVLLESNEHGPTPLEARRSRAGRRVTISDQSNQFARSGLVPGESPTAPQ